MLQESAINGHVAPPLASCVAYVEIVCNGLALRALSRTKTKAVVRGIDPYGTGGHVPPNIWTRGHYHECPPPQYF